MAGNLNINRNVTDVFYRYKMPRLIAKVEGKGNGIKTVIANMTEIAKALQRPPTYPTKYFGCELGAQTQFDDKNDRYIVNGSHESARLQDLLDGFIRKFVLCQECDNPETNLTAFPRRQAIQLHCIACGHTSNIDMRHKLTTFILKNPPPRPDSDGNTAGTTEQTSSAASTTSGKKERVKKSGKGATKNGGGAGGEELTNVERQASKESGHTSKKSVANDDDDDDWGEDTSADAVRARMEGLTSGAKTLTINDDLEKTQQERADIFYSFVQQMKVADTIVGADHEKKIVSEAERLDIKDKATMILAELLFDANILQQIKQFRSLICRFTAKNTKAQGYLLGGFEQVVGSVHPELMPKVPHILKLFYEEDILEEEVIIEWSKKISKKFVSKEVSAEIHAKAEPFITWLKEAEEESSDEGEKNGDDDGLEIIYSRTSAGLISPVASAATIPAQSKEGDEEEEDDINIDDI